jgi:hypothetical protein
VVFWVFAPSTTLKMEAACSFKNRKTTRIIQDATTQKAAVWTQIALRISNKLLVYMRKMT